MYPSAILLRRAEATEPMRNKGPTLEAIFKSLIYSSFSIYPIVYKSAQYFAPSGYPHKILAAIGKEQFFESARGLHIMGPKILNTSLYHHRI